MEHGHVSPNLTTEPSEDCSGEGPPGADVNIAGPSELKKSLLEINQSIETTKLKNNNDNIEAIKTVIQNKQGGKNHYNCKYCSQVFNKHQALGGHMNGHSKEQRNLEKFEKVTTWIHATYPPPPNTTLTSEAKLQGTPTYGATFNGYNHLVEVGDMYSQSSGQWTTQQLPQQIQLSQGLQTQQQQFQNYQAQEAQNYQTLERPLNTQALQRFQNCQVPQELQNYQIVQGLENHQALQRSQSYQTSQRPQYYQTSQGSQNYQTPQGSQNYQAPQRPQYYQIPQGLQYYQAPQRVQSYQTLQGSQNPQPPQTYQDIQRPQQFGSNTLSNQRKSTTTPFINEQLNKEYYAQLGPNVLKKNN